MKELILSFANYYSANAFTCSVILATAHFILLGSGSASGHTKLLMIAYRFLMAAGCILLAFNPLKIYFIPEVFGAGLFGQLFANAVILVMTGIIVAGFWSIVAMIFCSSGAKLLNTLRG